MNAPTGIVDMPEAEYHRRPELSQSEAKLLLAPNCPAVYRWQKDNGQPHKAVFDFGSAAHKQVLGVGQTIRYIQADSWRTNKAKAEQAEAYAADEIPLLEQDRGVIEGMAAALHAHPLAAALFNPENGSPEQSLFETDPETGVGLRGRLDWLPQARGGRIRAVDYKTTVNANPADFGKTAASFGYMCQDDWYRNLIGLVGLDDDPAFLFVLQAKTPPYLVSVVELDPEAKAVGAQLNRQAIDTFAECVKTDTWPGYPPRVSLARLPYWFIKQLETEDTSL